MFDGCCGLKGASASMRDNGWDVTTLDIEPSFEPDIVADIREYTPIPGTHYDLMWFSPPCTEFSFNDKPWNKDKQIVPDISIYQSCMRLVNLMQPRFWIIENVRGAVPYFTITNVVARRGPFYLWGYFPPLPQFKLEYKKKDLTSGRNPELRALIPYQLSDIIRMTIENNLNW